MPTAAGFINRGLDFAFAIFMLRTLGPTEVGRYTWAVLVVGYFDILINFGLGVLITRDISRDPKAADRYLGGAIVARVVLWGASIILAASIAGPLAPALGISPHVGLTLALLTIGIGISNISGLASALFNAAERMQFPACVTVFTSTMKVICGVVALVAGYGIVGIAVVAIVVNAITGCVLLTLLLRFIGRPHPALSPSFGVALARDSYPLMINNLLATLFFRVDGLILRASAGDTVLGWYGTAYKFIDGLNFIPANVTLALFPLLSRLSAADRAEPSGHHATALTATVDLALRALVSIALPVAVGTTILAEPIIELFAGERYLPYSAIALRILIWFAPFSFANGLLQYVLIALDRQRYITLAFVIAAAFNVLANVAAVPVWSYEGAAVVTVASEALLLVLFIHALRQQVVAIRLIGHAWRPAVAAAIMAPAIWIMRDWSPILGVFAGGALYLGVLFTLRGVSREELAIFRRVLPGAGSRSS